MLIMHQLELPEMQNLNIEHIAISKVEYAYNIVKSPVLVDDGGMFIEHYHQFPGAFSKYIVQQIGLQGVWELAKQHPKAYFQSCLVYKDATRMHCATGITKGRLIKPPQQIDGDYPYTHIFIPDGASQSYASLRQQGLEMPYSHRRQAVKDLTNFLNQ